nr:YggS family pyridoxal phosphate-dependent enzyme [Bacteroidota bacterium]
MPNLLHPYYSLLKACEPYNASLLAVTKNRKEKEILELYQMGQRLFGENKPQELIIKASLLPTEIQWHLIGHLQTNKVKHVLPYISCIHSLDSLKLWQKIDEEAKVAELQINCLLQIKIAAEDTKFGWNFEELINVLESGQNANLKNVTIIGVMGMATLTVDQKQIRRELQSLKEHF